MKAKIIIGLLAFALLLYIGIFVFSRATRRAAPTSEITPQNSQPKMKEGTPQDTATPDIASNRPAAVPALVSSQSSPETRYQLPSFGTPEEEKRFYSSYARTVIGARIDIPDAVNTKVIIDNDIVTVTFPIKRGSSYEKGPDYAGRVKFDRKTGRIIEVLAGS